MMRRLHRAGIAGLLSAALFHQPLAAQTPAANGDVPWQVPATTLVERQEMTFENAGVRLSGTLYAPRGAKGAPAVVAFHGAGGPSQHLALYRHLTELLPPLGIAVFLFDRRGSGKSGGTHRSSDYDLLADDGIAAAAMLARDPRIDAKRIGFWGLSQGGWLSLLAATRRPGTPFAIAVSAPLTTPDVQMYAYVENMLTIAGYGRADIDAAVKVRRSVDDYFRGTIDRAAAEAVLAEGRDKPWFDLIYVNRTLGDPKTSAWPKDMKHDPMKVVEKLKAPSLILFGTRDPVIPTAISVERLQPVLRSRRNVEMAVVAGADHAMSVSEPVKNQIDPKRLDSLKPDSAEYFARLADWLARQGLTARGALARDQ